MSEESSSNFSVGWPAARIGRVVFGQVGGGGVEGGGGLYQRLGEEGLYQ